MNTVWKYPLKLINKETVMMQKDALILDVQVQGSRVCLWAIVDPSVSTEERTFWIFGTGEPFDLELENGNVLGHVGTVQIDGVIGDLLLFHVFEETTID